MGDKIEAKRTAKRLGIPVVPGSEGGVSDEAEAARIAATIGYPVIIKATAGGGGRGMKVARNEEELSIALSTARSEAGAAFGNSEVYIEKYLQKPRHIEVQVFRRWRRQRRSSGRTRLFVAAPPPEGLGRGQFSCPQCRRARQDRHNLCQRHRWPWLSRCRHY